MTVKDKILKELKEIDREGISEIIKYLEESSFFSDPASCSGHNSYEGGLAEHSLNTYTLLKRHCEKEEFYEKLKDTVVIVGLLHDISLIGTFEKSFRNTPMKGKDGRNKKDEFKKLIFVEKPFYSRVPASLPYPITVLSSIMIKKHMSLTKLEDLAIIWNMPEDKNRVVELEAAAAHRLVLYTQFANYEAELFHSNKEQQC